jgi:hypothetical protein
MAISLNDTLTYIQTELVKDHVPELLQERYFTTDDQQDCFESKKIVLDFDEGDLRDGAFVKKGYVNGDTVSFISKEVMPPRSAVEDSIDPNDDDRQLFENLSKQPGATRALVWQALLLIKANRLKARVARDIEKLCVNAFTNNGIQGTMATSSTDSTPITIDINYYDEANGNKQLVYVGDDIEDDHGSSLAVSWTGSNPKPYDDVCALVRALANHGGDPVDLLLTPQMYSILRADKKFQNRFELWMHQNEGVLEPHLRRGAAFRGMCEFDGYLLNIITYSRSYKDKSNVRTPYLPTDFVCVTAPNCGRTLCGGTTHLDREAVATEDIGASFASKSGKFILSKVEDFDENELRIRVESRPLPVPRSEWRWMTALVTTTRPEP